MEEEEGRGSGSRSQSPAAEELEMAEEKGVVCREESVEGLRFWENWLVTSKC